MRDFNKSVEVITIDEKRKGFRRSRKVEKEKTVYNPGSVWLGHQIAGGRVLLPVATFESRYDGNCSYVQLGSEINDDSIFAVQGDEQAERLAIIEDLRKLLIQRPVHLSDDQPEYTDRISSFVNSECMRNANHITTALGSSIAATLSEKLSSGNVNVRSAFIAYSNSDIAKYEHAKAVLLKYSATRESESQEGCIEAVQAVDSEDAPITVGVFRRGNVGFPIAEFFSNTGEARFIGADHLDTASRYKSMMALMALLHEGTQSEGSLHKEFHILVGSKIDPADFLRNAFMIDQKIQEQLAPECEYQEDLAYQIGRKVLGVCLEGTVQDMNMTTTRGSVSGHVRLEAVNDGIEVRIIAKPDALEGIRPSEIASFVIDPTGPLGDQLPKGQDAEEFSTLLKGFTLPKK